MSVSSIGNGSIGQGRGGVVGMEAGWVTGTRRQWLQRGREREREREREGGGGGSEIVIGEEIHGGENRKKGGRIYRLA